jgi:hypothetical protein
VFLRKAGWKGRYVGTDLQEGFINIAKDVSPNEEFIAADCFEFLLSCEEKFDLVICLGVAHVFIEPFSLFRAVTKVSKRFVILDSKDIHIDMDGNPLIAPDKFSLISSNSACPVATSDSETFTDVRGLGCSITPEFVQLFLDTIGFKKIEFDTSLLTSGVYNPNPRRYRIMQAFEKCETSTFSTIQSELK